MSEPYFAEGSVAMLALEGMVDKAGLRNVLYALQHICTAKADHISTNWQDSPSARAWHADAWVCKRAANKIEVSK